LNFASCVKKISILFIILVETYRNNFQQENKWGLKKTAKHGIFKASQIIKFLVLIGYNN